MHAARPESLADADGLPQILGVIPMERVGTIADKRRGNTQYKNRPHEDPSCREREPIHSADLLIKLLKSQIALSLWNARSSLSTGFRNGSPPSGAVRQRCMTMIYGALAAGGWINYSCLAQGKRIQKRAGPTVPFALLLFQAHSISSRLLPVSALFGASSRMSASCPLLANESGSLAKSQTGFFCPPRSRRTSDQFPFSFLPRRVSPRYPLRSAASTSRYSGWGAQTPQSHSMMMPAP